MLFRNVALYMYSVRKFRPAAILCFLPKSYKNIFPVYIYTREGIFRVYIPKLFTYLLLSIYIFT